MKQENIRNFAIISHIDHGKSTLADRMLEITGTVEKRKMKERFLDSLEAEREHGVTIKMQAARMEYQFEKETYILNLIDTPGHVDFGYEVSRALAACEGALLLVDASQGIQAQTLSTASKAISQGVTLIPVINKIDLPNADVLRVTEQLTEVFGFHKEDILKLSAKTGEGVHDLLTLIVKKIKPPSGDSTGSLRALVFDTVYSSHKGVIAYVKVVDGTLNKSNNIFLMRGKVKGKPLELGVIREGFVPQEKLSAGEVGYIATGFKNINKCRVGDTVTLSDFPATVPLAGYQYIKPLVFASLFPVDSDDYESFSDALEKLALNDSSLEYRKENSSALGFGYRVGFLGSFHAEIIKERLEKEFLLDLIITYPTVSYNVVLIDGSEIAITSPVELPEVTKIKEVREPWVRVTIMTPVDYLSAITQLISKYRGLMVKVEDVKRQLLLNCEIPLAEIVINFHDDLKSLSAGYASFDYELINHRPVDLVRVDILVHKEMVPPFSRLVVRDQAEKVGRKVVETLKVVLPKQQFAIPIQAAIGGKVLARETLSAYRKDVTAKLYGGDRTRKDKLLKKQVRGKKRMREMGNVQIPKEAFYQVMKS